MNKKINFILAISIITLCALLVGTVVVLICLQIKSGLSSYSFETPQPKDETADWETYRNEEYSFEIKYPKAYIVSEITAKNNQFVTFSVDNLQVVIYPTDLSLDDFINEKAQSYLISDYQRINFLGQDAYEGVNQGMINAYEIATKNKGYIYELIFSTNNKDTLQELKAGLTAEQNQILSTFRFIEKNKVADWEIYTFLSPYKEEQWQIGKDNTIILEPIFSEDYPPFYSLVLSNEEELVGIIRCKIAINKTDSYVWDTKTVLNYCGAGVEGKEKLINPGRYKVVIVKGSPEPLIIAESEYFSIID